MVQVGWCIGLYGAIGLLAAPGASMLSVVLRIAARDARRMWADAAPHEEDDH
jgi:hypothetical protein